MTIDTVDDLHAAEEIAGTLAQALRDIAALTANLTVRDAAIAAADTWTSYCRGSCGAEGEAFQEQCDDESCGCPCGHVDAWEALPERDRQQYRLRSEYLDLGHAPGHLDGCVYGARFLLLEENVRGGFWLSTFDSLADATNYHQTQDYASEWTATEKIIDLDDGTEYEPGPTCTPFRVAGGRS